MTAHALHLDHLVVAARTLGEGAQYVNEALGVEPVAGGQHPGMRTHNRLLSLWGGQYLEIIACDPDATLEAGQPVRPRWFGLDDAAFRERLEGGPFLAPWVARVARPKNLARWQQQYPQRIPPVLPMTRATLAWQIGVPDNGALPDWQGAGDGIVPTLIQWGQPAHPSTRLPESGIALKALRGFHPRADHVAEHLRWLGAERLIALDATLVEPCLIAEFETPSGVRVLK
jgi:hypothetical protein